ncbi:hypothetical protein SDC9_91191 [bioreactor metagenome]|uniref:Uncharacterized protein n=1 Tax=bioreactor metagenome TaxID=1076179 RepID=A0A645A0Y6_9ZZZZ
MSDAGGRADQLGDDHIGPGPAQNQAQGFRDARSSTGNQHPLDDAGIAGTQGVGGLHQILACTAHGHGHHEGDLEHRADEDDQQLLCFAHAGPEDQQRNEGRCGQVAAE